MLFWCICIGYAEFYSHCILVEDTQIRVTLLAHRNIPGGIPQVAAFQLLLCICSENQLCPKSAISPGSSGHRKTTLKLCVAVSNSWAKNYGKLGNLCSSKGRDVMAAGIITAVPQRQSSAVWAAAAWDREGWEKPQQYKWGTKNIFILPVAFWTNSHFMNPRHQTKLLLITCKNEVLGGHLWFK